MSSDQESGYATKPMPAEWATGLSDDVLCRIVKGDDKGLPFGSPRNPRLPTIEEFNPRIAEIQAGHLDRLIVSKKHGILPEQAEQIAQLSNEDLICFRLTDPISGAQTQDRLALSGGHHRINEIIQRVENGRLDSTTDVCVLIHD